MNNPAEPGSVRAQDALLERPTTSVPSYVTRQPYVPRYIQPPRAKGYSNRSNTYNSGAGAALFGSALGSAMQGLANRPRSNSPTYYTPPSNSYTAPTTIAPYSPPPSYEAPEYTPPPPIADAPPEEPAP